MAITKINDQTKFLGWKEIINLIIDAIGDNGNLTTDEKITLVGAINEVDGNTDVNILAIADIISDIGDINNLTTTVTSNIVQALNGLQTETTANADAIGINQTAIGSNSTNIGTIGDLDTVSTDLVEAINEVNGKIDHTGLNPYFENFDNSRFSLDTGITISAFNKGNLLNSYNSSTITVGDKFINDNSDNGGSAGNMGGDAITLLAKLVVEGRSEVRYGYEFFIGQITAGGGTADVINFNATDYYPQTTSNDKYLGSINEYITWAGYVENTDAVNDILIGSTHPNLTTYIDGVEEANPYELSNATGWIHVRQKLFLTQEFKTIFPLISATSGNASVINIALSCLYRADVLDTQLGVVQ